MNATRRGNPWIDLLISLVTLSVGRSVEGRGRRERGFGPEFLRPIVGPIFRRAVIVVLVSLLPILHSQNAMAQTNPATPNVLDMSLEDLMSIEVDSVYGASGFKQKVTEAPASVTIITSDDIEKHGYRTLADILRNVRGFFVSYDRNYGYVGVRGFGLPGDYNSRVALMIDGHRMNDNIFEGNLLETDFPLDVDLIDRVEIIRGPNSSQYVASAFLAVINVIAKRGADLAKVSLAARLAATVPMGAASPTAKSLIMAWTCSFPVLFMTLTDRTGFFSKNSTLPPTTTASR